MLFNKKPTSSVHQKYKRISRQISLVAVILMSSACNTHTQSSNKTYFSSTYSQNIISAQQQQKEKEPDQAVDLTADTIEHDNDAKVVRAQGNVVIIREGRTLKADRVDYFFKEDRVKASGNVVLIEANGDMHFAQEFTLGEGLKTGTIKSLRSVLADDSRFWAEEGTRVDAKKIVLKNARYSPCRVCYDADKEKAPVWQLKADKVIWNEETNNISYRNAFFEIAGFPVLYTPYFRHPDGTIEQKSGILRPSFGFNSRLGFTVDAAYYFALDQAQDLTLGAKIASSEAPLLLGEYRKHFGNGLVTLEGSITNSSSVEALGEDLSFEGEDQIRGHIYGQALFDLNEKWRAGGQIALASDEQFFNEYDVNLNIENSNARDDDILQNSLFLERFDNRNYAQIRTLAFQDLRPVTFEDDDDQPFVLPQLEASFIGDPGSYYGGRLEASGSFLSLFRDGNGQDLLRGVGRLGWARRDITSSGIVFDSSASVRGDLFFVSDREDLTLGSNTGDEEFDARIFPQINVQASYPFAKPLRNAQIIFEPIASLTLATDVDNGGDIPNEDSVDVQLDTTNLFGANRFPGLDQIEDRSRVTYGLKTGVHDYVGNLAEIFFGQSYRFEADDNPFPEGSGLSDQESDYVGQIRLAYQDLIDLNYRFQLDGTNFQATRHEVTATGSYGPFNASTRYFFIDDVDGTGFTETREQITGNISYDLSQSWRLNYFGTYDFGEEINGLLRTGIGFDYFHECYSVSLLAVRNLTDDVSGESDTEIVLRFGLKNLAQFEDRKFAKNKNGCR